MRFFLPSIFAVAALGITVFAQEPSPSKTSESGSSKPQELKLAENTATKSTPKPGRKSEPATAAAPSSTPAAGPKRNLFQRVFGGGKPSATPEPKAAATPAPTGATHQRKGSNHRSEATEGGAKAGEKADRTKSGAGTEEAAVKPSADGKPADADSQPPKEAAPAAATPSPGKKKGRKGSAAAEVKPKDSGPPPTKEQQAVQQAEASGDPDAIEKAKYDEVKARASEDPKVKELKQKADGAALDDTGRNALKAYNRALFEKMRSLGDKDVEDRIESMEKAVMKNLGEN